MNAEIVKSLNQLLFEQEYITIPSFGSFEIKQQSAVIDPVTGKIHPPGSEISFSPTIQGDDNLLKMILVNHFGYSDRRADSEITQFVRDIKTKLEQKDIVYLNGIGKLLLNHDDEISFLPATSNYMLSNYGLPDVEYSPLQKNGHRAPAETPQEPAQRMPKKLRSKALPLLTILAFGIISVNVYFLAKKNIQENPVEIVQTIHVNQKPSILPSPAAFMDEITNIDTEEKDSESEQSQPAIEVEEELNVQQTKARTLRNNECIIIAGTFSTKKGAKKMIQSLLNKGYAPYKDKRGKSWRVGVIFPYSSVYDIKDALQDLSDTYETSAWILKK